jgi:hypothetical protein
MKMNKAHLMLPCAAQTPSTPVINPYNRLLKT